MNMPLVVPLALGSAGNSIVMEHEETPNSDSLGEWRIGIYLKIGSSITSRFRSTPKVLNPTAQGRESAPWVRESQPPHLKPQRGFTWRRNRTTGWSDEPLVKPRWGLDSLDSFYPGCASQARRPWALEFNTFGVNRLVQVRHRHSTPTDLAAGIQSLRHA